MAYNWANDLPDGGALPENSAGDPLATLTAADGTTNAVSYGIGDGSDGYGKYLFEIDNNGVLSPKTLPADYLDDYEADILVQYRPDRLFTATVNAYSAEGEVVASRLFVLTLQDVDDPTEWVENPATYGNIAENTDPATVLATFNAIDEDAGATIDYSFDESATDSAYFNIDATTGALTVKSAFNFEHPDRSGDNSYHVRVVANSSDGSLSITQDFRITVTDIVDEPAQWENNGNPTGNADVVSENIAIGTSVADFDAIDPEGAGTAYYGLSIDYDGFDGGHQDKYFSINLYTGELTTKSVLDFEDGNAGHYTLKVLSQAAEGNKGVAQQTFILTLTDVNEFETEWVSTPFAGGSLKENNAENVGPAVFNAVDGDGTADVTYSLSGDDVAYFSLNANTGEFYLKSSLDFEDPTHSNGLYSVIVNATSTDDSTAVSQAVILTVTDIVEEAAQWENNGNPTGGNLSENNATGVSLADFNAVDVNGDGISYSISNLGDGSYFDIDFVTGVLSAKSGKFDYEHQTHYTALVQAQSVNEEGDNGIVQQIFVLTIDNRTDEPRWNNTANARPPGATLAENNSANREVADFSALGNGFTINYWLTGDDRGYFNIGKTNGELDVNRTFDYENLPVANQDRYSVVVHASPINTSLSLSSLFVLTITDVSNEAVWTTNPTGNTISENIAIGTSVADFDSVNYDGDVVSTVYYGLGASYGISGGHQDDYFNIGFTTGVITTKSELDFENTGITNGHYTLKVLSQAAPTAEKPLGKGVISELFVLTLGDVADETLRWDAPALTEGRELAENNPATTTTIANFGATDTVDNTPLTYSLSGTDSADFAIDADTGILSISSSFNFEDPNHTDGLYSVIITATATDGASTPAISRRYVLAITDVDERIEWQTTPTGNADAVLENIAIDTVLATFVSTDPEGAGSYYGVGDDYGFVGGHQDKYFSLDLYTGELITKAELNYEEFTHYTILALSQAIDKDLGVGVISHIFVLTLGDVDEAIKWDTDAGKNPTGQTVPENATAAIGSAFLANDGDGGVTYSIVADDLDSDHFNIDADNGNLSVEVPFDFEEKTHYRVTVRATSTDGTGESITRLFVATVTDVDDPIGWESGGNPTGKTIDENGNGSGEQVADFGASHDDGATVVTYSLATGGADNSYFAIDADTGELSTTGLFNFEFTNHDPRYSMVVVATATDGAATSQLFILSINNVNEDLFWFGNLAFNPAGANIDENTAPSTTEIAGFVARDPDDYTRSTDDLNVVTVTYSLDGLASVLFSLDESGKLYLKSTLDYENTYGESVNNRYSIIVIAQSEDGSPAITRTFILTVNDVDIEWESGGNPAGIAIAENNPENFGPIVFNASDTDGATVTYSLSGDDAVYFSLDANTGELSVKSSLNFENPDHDPRYSVVVIATDNADGDATSQTFILTVTNLDEGVEWQTIPTGNAVEVLENIAIGTALATFVSTDPEGAGSGYGLGVNYGFGGGHQDAYFNLDINTGVLTTRAHLDFENLTHYTLKVLSQATDKPLGTDVIEHTFILTIGNVDEPTGNTISENLAIGTSVADFDNMSSQGNAIINYSLTDDKDAEYFKIDSNGVLTTKSVLDFETKVYYSVTVTAQAHGDDIPALTQLFVLAITDVNNTTAFSAGGGGLTIAENNAVGFEDGDRITDFNNVATPSGVKITYDISGNAADYFSIGATTGWLFVTSSLDFESTYGQDNNNRYSITIIANADVEGTAITQLFILTVTNIDENLFWEDAGNPAGNAINENNPATTSIADFGATHIDGTINITYSLESGGADNSNFAIDATTGELSTTGAFSFEDSHDPRYTVVVFATPTDDGAARSQTFILTINDVNEDSYWVTNPDANPAGANIDENIAPSTTEIAQFLAFERDGSTMDPVGISYSLGGTAAVLFSFGDNGILYLKSTLDFENTYGESVNNRYSVIVNAHSEDGSPDISRTFILTVNDVDTTRGWADGTPDGITLSENLAIGVEVVNINAKNAAPGGGGITFGITGDDADYFNIAQNNGIITFASVLDFENPDKTDGLYSIIIHSSATIEGTAITRNFVLTLTDIDNTTAFSAGGDGLTISENNVVRFNAGDRIDDFGNNGAAVQITYGLSGDAADYFSIGAGTGWLFITSSLDFESTYGQANNNLYSVTIIANADVEGTAVTQLFVLTVTDQVVEWSSTPPTGTTFAENNAVGFGPIAFNATEDDGATITYSLSGTDAAYFSIDADGGVYAASSFDFEDSGHTDGLYTVIVNATATDDANTPVLSTLFVLTITNINDNATVWENNGNPLGNTISENLAIGTSLADFGATDSDSGATITYSVASTLGDGEYFAIDSTTGILTAKSIFNFETPDKTDGRYSVLVYANSDDAITQVFVLTITDANDPVEWVRNQDGGYDFPIGEHGFTSGKNVFAFSAIDEDAGASVTYSLGGPDASYFVINNEGRLLVGANDLDYDNPNHGIGYSIFVTAHSTNDNTTLINDFILTLAPSNDETATWVSGGNPNGNTIAENNTVGNPLGIFNIVDADNPNNTSSFKSFWLTGDDSDAFSIDNGNLRSGISFDFENPADDADGNARLGNLYTVIVNGRDTAGGAAIGDGLLSISQLFILTITDVAPEPIVWEQTATPLGVREHHFDQDNNLLGYFRAVDGDGSSVTYSLSGTDSNLFSINLLDDGRLSLHSQAEFDYETQDHYSVVVTASSSDSSANISTLFYVQVVDQNDEATTWIDGGNPPSGAELAENNAVNAYLEAFAIEDPDNPNNNNNFKTYWLTGDDSDSFNINKLSTYIQLRASESFDFETRAFYTVVVNAYDSASNGSGIVGDGLLNISQLFVLTVTDVDDPIVFAKNPGNNFNLAENNTPGEVITVFSAYDGDGADIDYAIASGGDYFSINSETGQLYAKSSFDFEDSAPNIFQVIVIANSSDDSIALSWNTNFNITDVDGAGLAPDPTTPDQPVGINGKILFDGTTETIGGISDGIGNDGLVIIGNDLTTTQYDSVSATNITHTLNNPENFADSFVGYTDADGNEQNHWFFVRDDATDNTGHIVFDADGMDVNLESLANGGATTTPDQINLLAGLNFNNDGDFAKPDDLDLNLNNNNAASLTHDQFLALIGGSNNIDFI